MKPSQSRWFAQEIRKQRRLYDKDIKRGVVDKGFFWPALYLSIFIEGVFTLRAVPSGIEVAVPKGIFRLVVIPKGNEIIWVIRNDTFGCCVKVNPQDFAKWAFEEYPDGIGTEGYLQIVHFLLTAGCNDENEKKAIWDAMFYDEVEDAVSKTGIMQT